MKKTEFKALLKECILELVQEGKLNGPGSSTRTEIQNNNHPNDDDDDTQSSAPMPPTPNSRLLEATRITSHLLGGGDPKKAAMYQALVADTANVTLQKQLAAEFNSPGGLSSGNSASPEEKAFDQAQLGVFSASNRWAEVAFGKKPTAKQ